MKKLLSMVLAILLCTSTLLISSCIEEEEDDYESVNTNDFSTDSKNDITTPSEDDNDTNDDNTNDDNTNDDNTNNDNDNISSGGSGAVTDNFPNIAKQDNGGKDFNIMYPMWSLYEKYYFATEANGELINDVNFFRQTAINEHLGINIVGMPMVAEGGMDALHVVSDRIKKAAMSGDDPYQLALTHCYVGIASNIVGGYLLDFSSVNNMDFDRSYWRKDSMEPLAINGKMYLGSGKFLLYDPCVTLFNKDMLENADASFNVDDVYQLVRDKKWTIANMKTYASSVSTDANAGKPAGEGTYGYVCQNDWEVSSFMVASNYFVASKDAQSGKFICTPYSQRVYDIFDAIKELFDQPYTYHYPYSSSSEYISSDMMRDGQAMFATMSLMTAMEAISSSDAKIGILPIPSVDEGQDIKTLDWGGFMVIPISVVNPELSGAVSELLCYYGEKILYPAFYDKLLGTRTAENYADAEMLDIIFASLVSDPALAFLECGSGLKIMFYMFSTLIDWNSTEVSSLMATYTRGVNKELECMTK